MKCTKLKSRCPQKMPARARSGAPAIRWSRGSAEANRRAGRPLDKYCVPGNPRGTPPFGRGPKTGAEAALKWKPVQWRAEHKPSPHSSVTTPWDMTQRSTARRLAIVAPARSPASRTATPDAIQVSRDPRDENCQDARKDQMDPEPERFFLARLGHGDARSDYGKRAEQQNCDSEHRTGKPHC